MDGACRYLVDVEDDPELILLLVRALGELGLGGPARAWLQSRPELQGRPAECAALRQFIRDIPTGRISWEQLRSTFDENFAALTERRDLDLSKAQLLDALKHIQLFRDAAGAWHLSRRLGPGERAPREWLGRFRGPTDLQSVALPGPQPHLHVPLVLGVGMNGLVERVIELTEPERGRPHRSVFVLEPRVELFAAWLHAGDHRDALRRERVHWFIGETAVDRFEASLTSACNFGPHTVHVSGRDADELASLIKPILPRIAACRTQLMENTNRALATRSARRNCACWADRLKPGATIVGFASRHSTMLQYSMRDIGAALTQLGYDFRLELEPALDRPHTPLSVNQRIQELDPALVLLLNNLRHDLGKSAGVVPTLTWVQDPVPEILNRETSAKLGSLDFLCGYYQKRCTKDFGYDADRFYSIPFFPVNDRVFHDEPFDPAMQTRFGCDVAYVGHFHGTPSDWRAHAASRYPESLRSLLDRLYNLVEETVQHGRRIAIDKAPELVTHEARSLRAKLSAAGAQDIGSFYLYRLFDIHYRLQTLAWAAQWARRTGHSFHLYGNGWERHPQLRDFARGEVAHGEELRQAYRGAKLVIQSVPSGLNHQRTYEALAAGSLIVGRYSPADFAELPLETFTQRYGDGSTLKQSMYYFGFRNLQPITFDSSDSFDACANHLLANPSARAALLDGYRRVVLDRMTYGATVARLVAWLRTALQPATPA